MTKVKITIPGQLTTHVGNGEDIYSAIADLPAVIYPAVYEEASNLMYADVGKERFEAMSNLALVTLCQLYLPEALELVGKKCGWIVAIEEG